ncbi:MAG: class I SAM-dependent methyltransferase, partial [Gemmatimonadetes bacterium]|nr:class I SAM-dependent methyltransferase [Gemmatimonadota bacterium]
MTQELRTTPAPVAPQLPRPSTWFTWHDHLLGRGVRVLDLACGEGRHAIVAAKRGAEVVAVDRDATALERGKDLAEVAGVTIDWRQVDLSAPWPPFGTFDVVLCFNYLDRAVMPAVRDLVAPGGALLMETFLVAQRHLGWGPQSDDHLLRPGELPTLVAPLAVAHSREVIEPVEGERWRA